MTLVGASLGADEGFNSTRSISPSHDLNGFSSVND
jgi:hypothetical protein